MRSPALVAPRSQLATAACGQGLKKAAPTSTFPRLPQLARLLTGSNGRQRAGERSNPQPPSLDLVPPHLDPLFLTPIVAMVPRPPLCPHRGQGTGLPRAMEGCRRTRVLRWPLSLQILVAPQYLWSFAVHGPMHVVLHGARHVLNWAPSAALGMA